MRREVLKFKPNKILSVSREVNILTAFSTLLMPKKPDIYFRVEAPLTNMTKSLTLKNIVHFFFLNITYPFAKKVIPNSKHTLDTVRKYYFFGKNYDNYIGNPVYLEEKIKSDTLIKNIKKNKIILNIARFYKEKDHKTLIKAFSIINKQKDDTKLILVGEGPLKNEIKSFIKKKIKSCSKIISNTDEVSRLYDYADIFVLSSLHEGFGNVIVEALSRGVPVVSTKCGSLMSEIFKNESHSYLSEVGDYQKLARNTINVLENKNEKDFYKKYVSKYKINHIGDLYLNNMELEIYNST